MSGDEIKALRRRLDCTARQLGAALGVEQATVLAWEREELFPTRHHVEAMRALVVKKERAEKKEEGEEKEGTKAQAAPPPPFEALADPVLWKLFRKLLANPELRAEVEKLAAEVDDPASP